MAQKQKSVEMKSIYFSGKKGQPFCSFPFLLQTALNTIMILEMNQPACNHVITNERVKANTQKLEEWKMWYMGHLCHFKAFYTSPVPNSTFLLYKTNKFLFSKPLWSSFFLIYSQKQT